MSENILEQQLPGFNAPRDATGAVVAPETMSGQMSDEGNLSTYKPESKWDSWKAQAVEGLTQTIGAQTWRKLVLDDLESSPVDDVIQPTEANRLFPYVEVKFDKPVSKRLAEYLNDLAKDRHNRNVTIANAPKVGPDLFGQSWLNPLGLASGLASNLDPLTFGANVIGTVGGAAGGTLIGSPFVGGVAGVYLGTKLSQIPFWASAERERRVQPEFFANTGEELMQAVVFHSGGVFASKMRQKLKGTTPEAPPPGAPPKAREPLLLDRDFVLDEPQRQVLLGESQKLLEYSGPHDPESIRTLKARAAQERLGYLDEGYFFPDETPSERQARYAGEGWVRTVRGLEKPFVKAPYEHPSEITLHFNEQTGAYEQMGFATALENPHAADNIAYNPDTGAIGKVMEGKLSKDAVIVDENASLKDVLGVSKEKAREIFNTMMKDAIGSERLITGTADRIGYALKEAMTLANSRILPNNIDPAQAFREVMSDLGIDGMVSRSENGDKFVIFNRDKVVPTAVRQPDLAGIPVMADSERASFVAETLRNENLRMGYDPEAAVVLEKNAGRSATDILEAAKKPTVEFEGQKIAPVEVQTKVAEKALSQPDIDPEFTKEFQKVTDEYKRRNKAIEAAKKLADCILENTL